MRLLTAVVCLTGVFARPCSAAERRSAGEKTEPEPTIVRVVHFAEAPLIVRFEVLVDLVSIAEQRRLAAIEAVRVGDLDGDGHLSLEEARSGGPLPRPNSGTVEAVWRRVDDDGDGRLDPTGFARLLDEIVGPPVDLQFDEDRSFSRLSLERLLDDNRDGFVEADEWTNGWRRLARVDFDDDDTLSAAELSILDDEQMLANVGPQDEETGSVPSFAEAGDPQLPLYVRRLAKVAATDRGWAGRRWDAVLGEQRDLSDTEAITRWASDAPADLVAKVRLSNTRDSYVLLEPGPAQLRVGRVGRQSRRSRAEGQLARTKVEFRVTNSGFVASDSRNYILSEARRGDQDQNDYLDSSEFGMIAGNVPSDFETLDLNHDEMLRFDELAESLDAMQRFAQLQVRLKVGDVAQRLFERLDVDIDRRLSPRELSATAAAQTIDLSRMTREFRITAETDAINLLPVGEMTASARLLPVVRDRQEGPAWFRMMDRNRDGDVAWREFLGPRSAFDHYDRDGDGLISPLEAD